VSSKAPPIRAARVEAAHEPGDASGSPTALFETPRPRADSRRGSRDIAPDWSFVAIGQAEWQVEPRPLRMIRGL